MFDVVNNLGDVILKSQTLEICQKVCAELIDDGFHSEDSLTICDSKKESAMSDIMFYVVDNEGKMVEIDSPLEVCQNACEYLISKGIYSDGDLSILARGDTPTRVKTSYGRSLQSITNQIYGEVKYSNNLVVVYVKTCLGDYVCVGDISDIQVRRVNEFMMYTLVSVTSPYVTRFYIG